MFKSALILIIGLVAQSAYGAPVKCPGGYEDGQRVDIGRYWYTCENGHLAPKGCFDDNGRRMNAFESYHTSSYTIRCEYDSKGDLMFNYKGCFVNNKEYYPGQSWEEGRYWYTCTRKSDSLSIELTGCVFEKHRFTLGQRINRDDYVYECRKQTDSTCAMCPVACLHNGRTYEVGQTIESPNFWFVCTKNEKNRVEKKLAGCIYNNVQMNDGGRYTKENTVYECRVRENQAPEHRAVGCSAYQDNGNIIERPEGCEWSNGDYMMKCMADGRGRMVSRTVKCFYKPGAFELNGGCFKVYGNTVAGCKPAANGQLRLVTYSVEMLRDVMYKEQLRMC
uniref:Abnormal cell migration protein 18-like fibronectin type I domain-containing protein n=1 Tax=Romanomermis culicivorax TaxID=13658 RepID=A0A915HRH8_ROMCU